MVGVPGELTGAVGILHSVGYRNDGLNGKVIKIREGGSYLRTHTWEKLWMLNDAAQFIAL